jgi:FAD/FMN-containing dehydrogenase
VDECEATESREKVTIVAQPVHEGTLKERLLSAVDDPGRVIDNPAILQRLSRDFYWYSPVLKKLLDDKIADLVVQPVSAAEVQRVLACCYANNIPVTARGSGTGNYGQAVPLAGGVVLDLSFMDKIEAIRALDGEDAVAVCGPGVRLAVLEAEARKVGWELRCYPSTVVKASVGGFLGGGSGGIGSVSHGGLRDFGTVRAIEVVTMEAEPRVLKYEGEKVHDILHAWGTNGIITRIWLTLTPAVEWAQCVVAFDSFDDAFTFAETVANGTDWVKRLVTVFEWPIPSFFSPIKQVVVKGKALIFFIIAASQLETLSEAAKEAGGEISFSGPHESLKTTPLLSDYTWNHTTLWAIRADSSYTYLQCGFDRLRAREQFMVLKQRFADDFLFHIEFMKNGQGDVVPGSIPVVRFTTEQRLNEMIDFCREIGVSVANPHVNHVEGGGRYREDNVQLLAKHELDAKGLLNPGKMATFVPRAVTNEGVAQ